MLQDKIMICFSGRGVEQNRLKVMTLMMPIIYNKIPFLEEIVEGF